MRRYSGGIHTSSRQHQTQEDAPLKIGKRRRAVSDGRPSLANLAKEFFRKVSTSSSSSSLSSQRSFNSSTNLGSDNIYNNQNLPSTPPYKKRLSSSSIDDASNTTPTVLKVQTKRKSLVIKPPGSFFSSLFQSHKTSVATSNPGMIIDDSLDDDSSAGNTPITPTVELDRDLPLLENSGGRSDLSECGNTTHKHLESALPILGTRSFKNTNNQFAFIEDFSTHRSSETNGLERRHDTAKNSVESFDQKPLSNLAYHYHSDLISTFRHVSNKKRTSTNATSKIFSIPEIVSLIVEHVDAFVSVPQEKDVVDSEDSNSFFQERRPNTMFSCLLVNKLWYRETSRALHQTLHFSNSSTFNTFLACNELKTKTQKLTPKLVVLHKLGPHANQFELDSFGRITGGRLEWVEFYTCPQIYPPRTLFAGGQVKTVILPGCTGVTDSVIDTIAKSCPLLQHLDLRACEMVSDRSIRIIAHYCPNLNMLNVGRTRHGNRITNKGIRSIARHTKITTLGVAGCHITDSTVWELAIHRGRYLERLSFNNCQLLTNNSIPRILGYMTRSLSVLELKNCPLITEMTPLVLFKKYRQSKYGFTPLIEGCDEFERRMKKADHAIELEISKQIFQNTLEWIYSPDDDVTYNSQ